MALHDPVEDALNARKKRARLVEAGGALSPDSLDITRKFLGGNVPPLSDAPRVTSFEDLTGTLQGGRRVPSSQAALIAGQRAFGQQGAKKRLGGGIGVQPLSADQPLSSRILDLPGPVGFAQTPQGRAILQRILGRFGGQQRRG